MSKKVYAERNLRFETLQLHVGQEIPDIATDARAVPIYQTSSYVFRNSEHAAARFGLSDAGNIYGRLTNPTEDVFEKRIAALEGGVAALAVASGAAAISYTIQNLAQNGDHIVAAKNIYGGSYNLLAHTLPQYGITTTFVDPFEEGAIERAIKENTKAVYIETLGNPNSEVVDIEGIANLAQAVVDEYYKNPDKPKGKGVNVTISLACFVPKPFTPFQFEPQNDFAQIEEKQKHLRDCIKSRKISVSLHNAGTSLIEAVLARGDRRVGEVIYTAWKKGCKFDGWDEYFDFEKWKEAFNECGVTPDFYAYRKREYDEVMPWEHIDLGISKKFLANQDELAHKSISTPNCRQKCAGCGATVFGEGICCETC